MRAGAAATRDALELTWPHPLGDAEEETLAPAAVRERVACALCGFPQRAAAHAHCAHARVPFRVAALLQAEPQMVVRLTHGAIPKA